MTSVVQFRMDSEDKEILESVLKSMGLDLDTAFRMFAVKVIHTGEIPFNISADSSTIMTKENLKAYKQARKELKRGEAISHKELKEELGL